MAGVALSVAVSPQSFDLTMLAREMNHNSIRNRVAGPIAAGFMIAISALFLVLFLSRILHGTLDAAGWLGLLAVWVVTGTILSQSRYLIWQARGAAVSLLVSEGGVELQYPEGRTVQFRWSDPNSRFMLYDATDAPSFRRVLSTNYFLGDHQRVSALPRPAYQKLLEEANRRAVVAAKTPKRSILVPSLYIPVNWEVRGKATVQTA
jgi:hypothetical protein